MMITIKNTKALPIIIDSHVADQEDFSIFDESREWTVDFDAGRNVSRPIAKATLHREGKVEWPASNQFKSIFTLEDSFHAMISLWRNDHPIFGSFWHLLASCWRAWRYYWPGPIVANNWSTVVCEFIIFNALNKQSFTVLHNCHIIDVITIIGCNSNMTIANLWHHTWGQTLGKWISPFSIYLANGRCVPFKFHVFIAAENDARPQSSSWDMKTIFCSSNCKDSDFVNNPSFRNI